MRQFATYCVLILIFLLSPCPVISSQEYQPTFSRPQVDNALVDSDAETGDPPIMLTILVVAGIGLVMLLVLVVVSKKCPLE